MRRREFLCALATALVVWPLVAKAQSDHVRLVGVLMAASPDDPESQARITALQQGLQQAGWINGRNMKLDTRWSGSDIARLRRDAADLIAKGADVIVGGVGPTLPVLQQTSRIVPVVMAQAIDPVGAGFVQSLAQPGGNMTGFTQFEYSLSGKWLELLKEIAPQVSRVGVVRDLQGGPVGIAQWAVIGAFASPMGVELSPINLSETADTKPALAAFLRGPNDGLIVTVGSIAQIQRDLVVTLAAQHRLPTVYPYRFFVEAGGLISYGPNLVDQYRRAASYVDRILKGEKPANLPVQMATKYELVINLKTAKSLGITVSPSLLARADEVIE